MIFKVFELKYKREIKQMIKEGFPEDQLVTFAFKKDILTKTIPHFKWMKKNEFRYKGEMYDIVRTKVVGDSIFYKCIHDVKESGLFSNLERYLDNFRHENPDKNNEFLILENSLSKFYYNLQSLESKKNSSSKVNFFDKDYNLLEGNSLIFLPPPNS